MPSPMNFPNMQRQQQRFKPGALRDEDFFVYEVDIAALVHQTTQNPTIAIDNDSAFIWYQSAYFADIAAGAVTDSSKIVPLATLNLNDGGSSRNIFNNPVPIPSIFGTGENPFILPKPRVFVPGASILLDVFNFSAATDYNIKLCFIGIKDFTYKQQNPNTIKGLAMKVFNSRQLRRQAMLQAPIAGRQPGERHAPPAVINAGDLPFYKFVNFGRIATNSKLPTLQENRRRVHLAVQNQGLSNIYISFSNWGNGLLVKPDGYYEVPYYTVNSSVYVYTIAAGASSNIVIVEGTQ